MSRDAMFGDGAALVFGGSGGLGSVIARAFGVAGSAVGITYRRNASRAGELIAEFGAAGFDTAGFAVDVTERDQVERAVAEATARFDRLHTIVFVAGAMPTQTYLSAIDDADWKQAIDVEVNGLYNVVRATLPHMKQAGGGSFVHLGSAGELAWASRDGLSVVPKAANEALMRGIAKEEGRFNIRANSVLIGVIEAGMYLKFKDAGVFDDAWVKATHQRLALKRLGRPEEVAEAVVFLASKRASYITGQQIAVAGGYGL